MQTNHRVASRRLRPLVMLGLLLLAPLAVAQDGTRIEQQMSHEQFKAAGLDRLAPEQLANLNAWLNRTLETETDKAAQQAEDRVAHQSRGLMGGGSREPVVARLQGGFDGFGRGRSYTLDNGQVWRQTDSTTLVGAVLQDPQVRVTPSLVGSNWFLQVEGFNTRAKVERIK